MIRKQLRDSLIDKEKEKISNAAEQLDTDRSRLHY